MNRHNLSSEYGGSDLDAHSHANHTIANTIATATALPADIDILDFSRPNFEALQRRCAALQDDNEKLMLVEKQFWNLMEEREALVEKVKGSPTQEGGHHHHHHDDSISEAGRSTAAPSAAAKSAVTFIHGAGAHEVRQFKKDYEKMHNALNECMQMLIDVDEQLGGSETTREAKEAAPDGTIVGAFLEWLRTGGTPGGAPDNRSTKSRSIAGGSTRGGSAVPSAAPSVAPSDKLNLMQELSDARSELRQLQEELDRTDLSRLQAVEDAERLQQQMETLTQQLSEVRAAYATLKDQVDSTGSAATHAMRRQIADRDVEIERLKLYVEQLHRNIERGATDIERIKREQQQRMGSSSNLDSPSTPRT